MNAEQIKAQLSTVLKLAAKNLQLQDYTVNQNLDVLLGDGFMGEFYKASITNNLTKEEIFLAIKKAESDEVSRKSKNIDLAYFNEIHYYTVIVPELKAFVQEKNVSEDLLACIPEYFGSIAEDGKETIVMRDITKSGYVLRQKDMLLDDEHARLIFKNYGQYHAISFALKDQHPERYDKFIRDIKPIGEKLASEPFANFMKDFFAEAKEVLDEEKHPGIKAAFDKYVTNTYEVILEAFQKYKGKGGCLRHGDCWSNNMMFKYEDSKNLRQLTDMKIFDFQLIDHGSPACDLAYFFYTGASDELYNKLDEYLELYMECFMKTVRLLGSDPSELLSKDKLIKDWKTYGKFGLVMSILVTKLKLISKDDAIALSTAGKNQDDNVIERITYNKDVFAERSGKMITHMYKLGAL